MEEKLPRILIPKCMQWLPESYPLQQIVSTSIRVINICFNQQYSTSYIVSSDIIIPHAHALGPGTKCLSSIICKTRAAKRQSVGMSSSLAASMQIFFSVWPSS